MSGVAFHRRQLLTQVFLLVARTSALKLMTLWTLLSRLTSIREGDADAGRDLQRAAGENKSRLHRVQHLAGDQLCFVGAVATFEQDHELVAGVMRRHVRLSHALLAEATLRTPAHFR
jgi:hypothetical protein